MKLISQKGFSLIELLLVIIVIGTSVFLLANLPNAINLISKSNHLSIAREIAIKQIEDKRALSYANLMPDTLNLDSSIDPRMSQLPVSSGTVMVAYCDPEVDLQYCPNGEHIKIIKVSINWKDNNKVQSVKLDTFIGEGGINQ